MKKSLLQIFVLTAASVFLSGFAYAQQDSRVTSAAGDMYVISAKAGGVNYVEGKVAVARKNAKSGYLIKGDNVEIGDRVVTGTDGKAEILLNPGSYVRLGEKSAFEFVSTNLEDLKLKLNSGSAIFEVFAGKDFLVSVMTPQANFYLIESGIYRIDVLPDGTKKIEVWKGKAQIGDKTGTIVKGGKVATIQNGQLALTKFDRDEKDALETWSKLRAKELAKINSTLQRRAMRDTLLNSYNSNNWNFYNSFGLWVYDRFSSNFCFLPFGYGWSSPYGYGFNYDFWSYRFPRYVYTQPPPGNAGSQNPGGNNANTAIGSSINPSNSVRSERLSTPPFQRLGGFGTRGNSNPDVFDSGSASMPSSRSSFPSAAPPPSAPVESSAKAPKP